MAWYAYARCVLSLGIPPTLCWLCTPLRARPRRAAEEAATSISADGSSLDYPLPAPPQPGGQPSSLPQRGTGTSRQAIALAAAAEAAAAAAAADAQAAAAAAAERSASSAGEHANKVPEAGSSGNGGSGGPAAVAAEVAAVGGNPSQLAAQLAKNVGLLVTLQNKWAWYQLGKLAKSAQGQLTSATRVVSVVGAGAAMK